MFRIIIWASVAFATGGGIAFAQPTPPVPTDSRLYELRTYYAAPGKLDALHARFRDHTRRIMERHGVTSHGFWTPADDEPDRVIALVSYPSAAARGAAWAGFATDPEWLAVKRTTERGGRLVERITDLRLTGALAAHATAEPAGRRVFEIKSTRPGEAVEVSGQRVGQWMSAQGSGATGQVTLIARPMVTARGQEPDVRPASAFVSAILTVTDDTAARSRMLVPTDYSPIK